MTDEDRPPWEDAPAQGQKEELERMLGLPSPEGCEQCAAYAQMLKLLMEENTELHAKVMEAELGRSLAEEMLPRELRQFLLDQAKAAERIAQAKRLKEEADALGQIQGLSAPVATGRVGRTIPPPVAAVPAPPAPLGKIIDWRGVAVPIPNTITEPDNSWIMPFGKYRGRMLVEVPTDYLQWCIRQDWLRPEPRLKMNAVVKERLTRKTP